jgi:hypothetical protein
LQGQQILGLLTYKSGAKRRGVEKRDKTSGGRRGCVGDGNRDVGGGRREGVEGSDVGTGVVWETDLAIEKFL